MENFDKQKHNYPLEKVNFRCSQSLCAQIVPQYIYIYIYIYIIHFPPGYENNHMHACVQYNTCGFTLVSCSLKCGSCIRVIYKQQWAPVSVVAH